MMMGKTHGRFRLMLAGAAMSALIFGTAPALAETPADTLVQAWAIDDIISLDPAEAFELSTGEITGNTYDMLVRLDVNDTTKVVGGLAESWTVSDDGLTYTFKLKPNLTFASGNPDHRRRRRLVVRARRQAQQDAGLHHPAIRPDRRQRHRKGQGDGCIDLRLHRRQGLCAELRAQLPDRDGRGGGRQQAGQGARRRRHAERRIQVRQ